MCSTRLFCVLGLQLCVITHAARLVARQVTVNGIPIMSNHRTFVSPERRWTGELRFSWAAKCIGEPAMCQGCTQIGYDITIEEVVPLGVVHHVAENSTSNYAAITDSPWKTQSLLLTPDALFNLTIALFGHCSTTFDSHLPSSEKITQFASTSIVFKTTPITGDFTAKWISGGTQIRKVFALPDGKAVASATAYASGLGCYALTINGIKPDNSSFMDPGWSNLPTLRNLYRGYDVSGFMQRRSNVIGARLGMCKVRMHPGNRMISLKSPAIGLQYGYQGAFCKGAGGSTSTCRAFWFQLNVQFTDGSNITIASDSSSNGGWQATNTENPIVYDHLYNGEIYDARIGTPGWDTPEGAQRDRNQGWHPVEQFEQTGTKMTLLSMPPIAVSKESSPVSIVPIQKNGSSAACAGSNFFSLVIPAGSEKVLQCATGIITKIEFASFGNPAWAKSGRFVAGSLPNGNCADPAFVAGCIFWVDNANLSKRFVQSCITAPCNIDACAQSEEKNPQLIQQISTGTNFTCDSALPKCGATAAEPAPCDDPNTITTVEKICVGLSNCTLKADPTLFGNACSENAHRQLLVVASGCTPKHEVAYVADFGRNQAGFTRLNKVTGLPGTIITLKHAEVLRADGSVNMDWCQGEGSQCICTTINCANQTDAYILRGDPDGETYTPSFTYHGFRYVQIEGWPGFKGPEIADLTAMFVHSDIQQSGNVSFNKTFQILNEIQEAYIYTQLSNMHSHPTDCPTREKRGWTGDSQLTSGGASLNFNAAELYGNWLGVMADHQQVNCALHNETPVPPQANVDICCDPPNNGFGCDYTGLNGSRFSSTSGSIADVIPFTHVGGWPGDPSWGIAGVVINWESTLKSGDIAFAREHYATSKRVVDFMSSQIGPFGLVEWGYYGDWLSLEQTEHSQVTGWSHILAVSRLADLANLTGNENDFEKYSSDLAHLKSIYHQIFFDSAKGIYRGGSQTAQILPLYLNITPQENVPSVLSALVTSIKNRGNTTTAGIVGTAYLLQVLEKHAPELALSMATAESEPSLGYMVKVGPGTIWESWTGTTNSRNHPALSATYSKYLYSLAGLSFEDINVWLSRRIRVFTEPGLAATIKFANASANTIWGTIAVSWSVEPSNLSSSISVQIPVGVSADVHVPVPSQCIEQTISIYELHSGKHIFEPNTSNTSTGIQVQKHSTGRTVKIDVPSGPYSFQLRCSN